MTLRQLAKTAGYNLEAEPGVADSALLFVLNRSYLVGLKTLAYSLLEHRSLLDLPVIILSEEHDLADDAFVAAFADRFIPITDDDIAQFSSIPSGRIDPRVRLDWIPKYTHLKWMMFDDFGVGQIIWIDTDIVCTASVDDLTSLRTADLYASPVFSKSLYNEEDGERRPQPERDARIWEFSSSQTRQNAALNTGVLIVNRPLLDSSFRRELISIATEREYTNEQTVVSGAMRRRGPDALGWLSPFDNYNHGYIPLCSEDVQRRIFDRVRLLHFVGANEKPWEREHKKKGVTVQVWWDYYNRARSVSALFA